MILSVDEAKKLLGIQDSSKDSILTALIPDLQNFLFDYCKNYFEIVKEDSSYYNIYTKNNYNKDYYLESSYTSFQGNKIINSFGKFLETGFMKHAHVRVQSSILNDGVYEITDVSETEITCVDSFIDESEGEYIRLSVVSFPKGLKIPFSRLLAFELNQQAKKGINSENLADHSISFSQSYPQSLLSALAPYRRLKA